MKPTAIGLDFLILVCGRTDRKTWGWGLGERSKRVMVVEDDSDTLDALASIIRDEGYDVIVAREGGEALHCLDEDPKPSLILLDVWMPGMNGLDFLKEKSRSEAIAPIPTVLLSGDGDLEDLSGDFTLGGVIGHLRKPFEASLVIDTVAQCLQNDRA